MPNHRFFALILGFDVAVGILPRRLSFVAVSFYVLSLVGINPGRASLDVPTYVITFTSVRIRYTFVRYTRTVQEGLDWG